MPAIKKESPFYSEQLQVSYVKSPNEEEFFRNEKMHFHKFPIEEFYFILEGRLEVNVGGEIVGVKSKEILSIPPETNHRICFVSENLEMLVFRAPISTDNTKVSE